MNPEQDKKHVPFEGTQQTYEKQRDQRIEEEHAATVKRFGVPTWMLIGFPALSNEPDEDDPIDW